MMAYVDCASFAENTKIQSWAEVLWEAPASFVAHAKKAPAELHCYAPNATKKKIRADYDQCKWSNIRDKGYKAECLDCAAKLKCSACNEKHAADQMTSAPRSTIRICRGCEGRGYGPRALETHQCGHCSFAGGAEKFDKKSIKKANERGHRKKCLQCKATTE